MGGDSAPQMVVRGANIALQRFPHVDFLMFGREDDVESLLEDMKHLRQVTTVVHTEEMVASDDKPSAALRTGRNSSMRLAINAVRDGRAQGVVSAGNTGAKVTAAQMFMRRLKGVHRPGIAVAIPTFAGQVTLIDVGANIEPKPIHLAQYGVMGAIYSEKFLGIDSPRVAGNCSFCCH